MSLTHTLYKHGGVAWEHKRLVVLSAGVHHGLKSDAKQEGITEGQGFLFCTDVVRGKLLISAIHSCIQCPESEQKQLGKASECEEKQQQNGKYGDHRQGQESSCSSECCFQAIKE